MNHIPLYPLRFDPIYQYRLWGGRRLANLLSAPLPGDGPIGEAWILSDRDDYSSVVANGPLKGQTLGQLLKHWPEQLLGRLAGQFRRFPLLLKFLDVRSVLSVQVHPSDRQTDYLPAGEHGDSAENRRLRPALRKRRGFWFASPATASWSTMAQIMPSTKATYCSCRLWSEPAFSNHVVQLACWTSRCRKGP